MFTVRLCYDYNLIAFQALDTDDLEDCEYSSRYRAETIGDMQKPMDFPVVWMILVSDTCHWFLHISNSFGSIPR